MVKVVFDTVVFVRSLINPHGMWGRLIYEFGHRYELWVSPTLLKEILEVIERPRLKQKYRTTSARGIEQLLDIMSRANVVQIGEIESVSRDPKDDMVLATAKAAGASYIVSEDEDLLTLVVYGEIKIVSAAAFLRLLEEHEP